MNTRRASLAVLVATWALNASASARRPRRGANESLLAKFRRQLTYERSLIRFPPEIDDPRLLYGDILAMASVALVHTLAVVVNSPDFPGWLAPVTSTPHFGEMMSRAGIMIFCFLVGFGYNDALSSGSVRTKDEALSSSSKAALDMTNVHLVVVLLANVLWFRNPIDVGDLAFDCAGAAGAIVSWRMFYADFINRFWF